MNEEENLSEEGLQDPYESELKKEKEAEKKRIEEAKDDLTEGKIRRKRTEEEDPDNTALGFRLFNAIDSGFDYASKFIAEAAEDKEGISDDVVRGTLKGLQFIGNLPVIKQIGQLEEGIVGGVRNLAERQDLIDPRAFTYSTRLGLAFAGDKGIRKVVKAGQKAVKVTQAVQKGKQIVEAHKNPALKGVLAQYISGSQPPSGSGFNWASFGYKVDQRTGKLRLPTLVQRAKDTGDLLQEYEVSDALFTYYTELESYIRQKGTRRGFAKFINPITGEVYNPAFAKNTDGSIRFSLSNARLAEATSLRARNVRDLGDKVYSSQIQKKWKRFKEIDRAKMNQQEILLASQIMDQKKQELLDLQHALTTAQRPQLSMSQRQLMEKRRIEIGNQIQSLKAGTYYGEHGYAIDSKVWDYVPLQKRYPNQKIRFQPGDAKNFHLIYEPDSLTLSARFEPGMRKLHQTFKKTKDNFDEVIEDAKIRYPDHVVHLNPNFEVGNAEKIIRIETLDSVRIHNEVMNQMSGTAVASFDWKKMGSRVWSKKEIREWLASQGIFPVGPKTYQANPMLKKTKGKRMPPIIDTKNPKKK